MKKLSPLDETRLLVKVSKLYYEDGLSQEEILARLNLSRSKISRLLQQAREAGIIQISVLTPKHLFSDLETRLERQFGLQEALVVESHTEDSPENIQRGLGIAAAGYLERSLNGFNTLGISWGATLNSMVAAVRPLTGFSGKVLQIIGGLGRPEAEVHAAGCKAGTALNPATPVESLREVVHLLDVVLILGNNPGFSGQGWFPEMAAKISHTARFLAENHSSAILQVDGGMTCQNLPEAYRAGARAFVSGSAIFHYPGGIAEGIQSLHNAVQSPV
ncbi:MAG: hypothetical protein Fur0016_05000 [Anaerolineales bacterium]